ncbi:MAG: glycosyltransferase [Defluviitaleaceae bacterium]|nr:glycosyltransferase [Defluviitaleaceae bacterium]
MRELYNENYYKDYGTIGLTMDYGDTAHWESFFKGIAKRIVDDFSPKTVLDVGCAWGYLVTALRDLGVEAYGLDISSYAISKVRDDIKQYCTVGSVLDDLPSEFPDYYDVVVTIEMIEHLHEEECMAAIEKLCNYSDKIIMSSSSDDITEPTHFNVQQPEYWAKRFAQFGYFNRVDYNTSYISKDTFYFEKSSDISRVIATYEQVMRLTAYNHQIQAKAKEKTANIYTSTVYKDYGDGFIDKNATTISTSGQSFNCQIDVCNSLKTIRFDPLEGMLCIVESPSVLSSAGNLPITNLNGFIVGPYHLFLTKDPQFSIDIPQGVTWVSIQANIYPCPQPMFAGLFSYAKNLLHDIQNLKDKSEALKVSFAKDIEALKLEILEKTKFLKAQAAEIEVQNTEIEVKTTMIEKLTTESENQMHLQKEALNRLQNELDSANAQIASHLSHIHAMQNSTFWRITKPARVIVGGVKLFFRKFPPTRLLYKGLWSLRRNGIKATWIHVKYYKNRTKQAQAFLSAAFDISDEVKISQRNTAFLKTIKISIITPLYNTPEKFLREMINSVQNQTYTHWELCLADGSDKNHKYVEKICKSYAKHDRRILYKKLERNAGISENTNRAIEISTGEYIAMLDHDDILHPSALYEVMHVICEKNADLIYTDESIFTHDPRSGSPYFKQDFAPDTLRSQNYMTHFCCYSRSLLDEVGNYNSHFDGSQDYDMILRLTESAKNIIHIPKLMYYWRAHEASVAGNISAKNYAISAAKSAITEHLRRIGLSADVQDSEIEGMYKLKYDIDGEPLISIIIPNKDHVETLKKCIDSIFVKSTYKNFEIIIVENNSTSTEIFDYYKTLNGNNQIKVVTFEGGFNYPAINNFGVNQSSGEYVILLNNDVEVITPDWLQEMLMFAQRTDVGVVGAKLYYPDNTIQHAGVIVGIAGFAGHSHKHFPRSHFGHMGRLKIAQNLSAVTGACMMLRRSVYDDVGGLDRDFAVALNDVDFCMRIRKAGYLIIFTPFAELYHHESKSRGYEDTPEKQARFSRESTLFKTKWQDELKKGDPYYNPNLTLDREDFSLR